MFRLVLLISLINYGQNANILGIFPIGFNSHYILDYKLMKGLADAGHNVTIVSPRRQETPPKTKGHLTEIQLDGFTEDIEKLLLHINLFESGDKNMLSEMTMWVSTIMDKTNKTLHHPKIKQLLESNQKFDAFIIEYFQTDALKVFGSIFDCPVIILSFIGPNGWINPVVGNPNEMSYIYHSLVPGNMDKPITFLERVRNVFLYVIDYIFIEYITLPIQSKYIEQTFPNAPNIRDLHTNVSMVLLNSHNSLDVPRPLVPNMVEIGGYHIDASKELPQDLQQFLDSATEGAIYFSMGSNLKSKDIPKERKIIILNVLEKLKQKVIWKFEEDFPEKPDNVLIRSWLPQQDILAHPNVKLFITHGGMLSTTEAIYHGVPILAIPVFADQPTNAERARSAGYGLTLNYFDKNFTKARFGELIDELLSNPKYRDNAKQRSKLFHDRPMKPMDTAVYWVEYAIRNKGAKHLRVGGISQTWYQYYMIDVALVLILSAFISTGIFIYLLKQIIQKICFKKYLEKKIKTK